MNELDRLIENLENGVNEAEAVDFDLANAERNLTNFLAKITKIKGFKIKLNRKGLKLEGISPDYAKFINLGDFFKTLTINLKFANITKFGTTGSVGYKYTLLGYKHVGGGGGSKEIARVEFNKQGVITDAYNPSGDKIKF